MVHFCEAVVGEIRHAYDHDEVENIISNSLVLFRESKSQNVSMYIINMIVMLRTSKIAAKTTQEHNNLTRAVEIFRELNLKIC